MGKTYLDIYSDYAARLLINKKPVSAKNLPISEALRQQIDIWDNNCHLEMAEYPDEWWDNHHKEEIDIAYALQNELPNMVVRRYYYTRFIELDKIAYEIEIIDGFEKGANFWIAPTITTETEDIYSESYEVKHTNRNGITLDEDFSFPYIYFFIKPYFDPYIQKKDDEIDNQYFNWWGTNYYTYKNIERVLSDMRNTIHLIINNYNSPRLNNWKDSIKKLDFEYLFIQKFYPKMNWHLLSNEEQNQFIEAHRYIFIDFYFRFISKMKEMMKNSPECDLIFFDGP